MKKLILALFLSAVALPAVSYDHSSDASDLEYKYESSTGTKYKYDLSDPSDSLLYEVDPAAQLMDEINPMVDIDRDLGQYGGGAKW